MYEITEGKKYDSKAEVVTEEVVVIRNFTVEPYFEEIMGRYFSGCRTSLYYFDVILNSGISFDSDILILLHLPFLLYDAYNNFYLYSNCYQKRLISEQADRVETLIQKLLDRLPKTHRAYLAMFPPTEKGRTAHGQLNFDMLGRELNDRLFIRSECDGRLTLIDTESIFRELGFGGYYQLSGEYITQSVLTGNALERIIFEFSSRWHLDRSPIKCIVLDCDGVLWGGILEEDDPDGILLSRNGVGRTYREFQRELLKLKAQGYLLCLCSKNDLEKVRSIFVNHEAMLLRWEDMASCQISFEPKSKMLPKLSAELHMPLEEMVFLDDNAFEIREVSEQLNVKTIHMNADMPQKYIEQLYQSGYFFKDSITWEDTVRTEQYRSVVYASKLGDFAPECINQMLGTVTKFRLAGLSDLQRVSELSWRTHQLNMSGIRYSREDLEKMLVTDEYNVYIFSVKDDFSDLGIIAAAVLHLEDNYALIESFFVSCRVLGRGFEKIFLSEIRKNVEKLREQTICWRAIYRKNTHNKKYSDFYTDAHIEVTEDI